MTNHIGLNKRAMPKRDDPYAQVPGFPSRDPELDVLPGFQTPPPGYGEVSFYWWMGDKLTRERIQWQMERLNNKAICGLQVNYAHSDQGGLLWGLTYPSDPPLFSEAWWDLYNWFLQEAKKNGMSVSLSDYTLGTAGQGWFIDEILAGNPEICGATLEHESRMVNGGECMELEVPDSILALSAYRRDDCVGIGKVDLLPQVRENSLIWKCPEGKWQVVLVYSQVHPLSIDPMNPLSGSKVIETFFQRFEDRNPGEAGKGLNFFFSDELNFGISGNLWNPCIAKVFQERKGYDLIPELPALFTDIGPRTPKIRLDYRDVMVELEEENYFRPVYEWHQSRRMIYGCDHGGRGRDVVEFGDYFRTQKWNQGPGNDQPALQSDIIKNKVSSSIAHLYERPRTWLEGFYGSGWGTSSAQVADAVFRNFAMGHNLLSLHGLFYSTKGGWWEWAPPCNHFHMPYWEHMGRFLQCSERLSYLMSQGVHCCDVAILYPVAAMEGGMDGEKAVQAAFSTAEALYSHSLDFDFIDFQSLERTRIEDQKLQVAGEAYRVAVLPSMKTLRYSSMIKLLEFYQAGGIVIAVGDLPQASDRAGYDDPQLDAVVREIFGFSAGEVRRTFSEVPKENIQGGKSYMLEDATQVEAVISKAFARDFDLLDKLSGESMPFIQHRRIGPREVFMVYGAPKGSRCFFRAKGNLELWDPWTGETERISSFDSQEEGTVVKMPLGHNEVQLMVFHPEETLIPAFEDEFETDTSICLDTQWEFELKPVLDNTWGDFRIPAFNGTIGAEVRMLEYAEEPRDNVESARHGGNPEGIPDELSWKRVTVSFGPRFWKLGPLPENSSRQELEEKLGRMMKVDDSSSVELNGRQYFWKPYEYSERWGIEGDPGHQGYHGLKGEISDGFIALGKQNLTMTSVEYLKEEEGTRYYLWTSVSVSEEASVRLNMGDIRPDKIRLNGKTIEANTQWINLNAGINTLLLSYARPGRTWFILEAAGTPAKWEQTFPLAMSWYRKPGVFRFDSRPGEEKPAGWYRFTSPPGLEAMRLTAYGRIQVQVDGKPARVQSLNKWDDGTVEYAVAVEEPCAECVEVMIRMEHQRGYYGGAALPEPIGLTCKPGRIRLGDWASINGLYCYSGGAWYRKNVMLEALLPGMKVLLRLGEVVSSAEVYINGSLVGIRTAPAWEFDITPFVRQGDNRVEILVYNTLANHYTTIPTRYRGSTVSGLLGPVTIEYRKRK